MNSRFSMIIAVSSIALLSACATSVAQDTSGQKVEETKQRIWVTKQKGPRPMHMAMLHDMKGRDHGEKLMDMDKDGDGRVSKAEFNTMHEDKFNEMDMNKDGYLVDAEIAQFANTKIKEAMEGLHFTFEDEDFDFNFDFDDGEFDEDAFEEEMERFTDHMERVGERVGRIADRANRMAKHKVRINTRRGLMEGSEEEIEMKINLEKDKVFAKLDKNNDGKISKDEYPGPDRRFTSMDKNKDGTLDKKELKVRIQISRMMGASPEVEEKFIIEVDEDVDK